MDVEPSAQEECLIPHCVDRVHSPAPAALCCSSHLCLLLRTLGSGGEFQVPLAGTSNLGVTERPSCCFLVVCLAREDTRDALSYTL